jgi:hypothetical protein
VLPLTPRIYECARLDSKPASAPSHAGGALPLSYGRLWSLRQESNPHLGRTKGACLPLTLRRREWRRRESNPRPPRCKRGALPPELRPQDVQCGRVESNHHSARRRGYNPLSSPMLSDRVKLKLGWPNGFEPIPAGLTTPDAALHHGHHEPGTGTTGLEPASSRLTSERSARLSYAPEALRGWDSNPRSRAHEAREDGPSSTALSLAGWSRTSDLRFPKPAGWPSSLQPDEEPPAGLEPGAVGACPRSGPVEGVWGNREVPPRDKRQLRRQDSNLPFASNNRASHQLDHAGTK